MNLSITEPEPDKSNIKNTVKRQFTSIELAQACAKAALDKKAENVSIINVSELTSYTDYLVICSGLSAKQVQAIARNIDDEIRVEFTRPLGIEGFEQGHWVLADYGDVVLHVFLDEVRAYYDLDGFWADAPKVAISSEAKIPLKTAHLVQI